MQKKTTVRGALVVMCAALTAALLTGCGPKGVDMSRGHVKIACRNETQNRLIAEIYADALEDENYRVTRHDRLSEDKITTSLNGKTLNLYPEYVTYGIENILKYDAVHDPDKAYQTLSADLQTMRDITALEPTKADNAPGFVITKEVADRYGITNTSSLQRNAANLRFLRTDFAKSGDFDYAGAEKTYGTFSWSQASEDVSESKKYQALLDGTADVCCGRAADGYLEDGSLVFLEDDRSFWPTYQTSALVHNNLLTHRTVLGGKLIAINRKLTLKTLRHLSAEVDVRGRSVKKVAAEYYRSIADDLPHLK